jgi:hypothetical protein
MLADIVLGVAFVYMLSMAVFVNARDSVAFLFFRFVPFLISLGLGYILFVA